MKAFITDNFLLASKEAQILYHDFAKDQPIIDYHCHLDPALIADDHQFSHLWEAWLKGDHYKWRAMRANGIGEQYITGSASSEDKFLQWAATVPKTMRNPLYHWTHLELLRYFEEDVLLGPATARGVLQRCNEKLQQEPFSCRHLLRKMNVEVVCTTDDPIDDLEAHQHLSQSDFDTRVLPTFRPDKASNISDLQEYNAYLDVLGAKAGVEISRFDELIEALEIRHDYFHSRGCRLADHGLSTFLPTIPPAENMHAVFKKIRRGSVVNASETSQLQNAILLELARMNHEKGWVQQYHYGALRNTNSLMFQKIGPDSGYDSIGDFPVARALSRFLDYLNSRNRLAKTIIYNLNPADNHVVATLIGSFQDGSVPGKMQFGSGWWFLDQKDGMESQMNVLSNMGLLSRFVGMLTDSRSFLSYPRHEYFRRILCHLLGEDIKNGLLPNDLPLIGQMVQDISYNNAREYFGFYS